MARVCIHNGTVVSDTILHNGAVVVDDGRITFVGDSGALSEAMCSGETVDAQGAWVFPGFLDVHIHGAAGHDFMEGDQQSLAAVAAHLAQYGVAGFLPSTVTASREKTRRACQLVADFRSKDGAEVLGIHLEGPYINESKKGAQYGGEIRSADLDELAVLYGLLGEQLRLVTLAPEVPGGLEAVDWLVDRGITVSVGHSDASFEETMAGFAHGISHVTHTFNGMRGLHHRDPGVVGAAFAASHVFAEIIADGVHVHPGAIQGLLRAKGVDWMILVTDAVQAQGLPDGPYILGDQPIFVKDGEARLEAGNLAGSTLNMLQAVRNMVDFGLVSLKEAVQMASLNPARTLGLKRRGWIREGYKGDVVVVSPQWVVQRNYVSGQLVYVYER